MKIAAALMGNYPGVAMWICNNLPKARNKPKIFNSFKKYASLTDQEAIRAINHGSEPEIDYRHMPTANGEFWGAKYPNTVFISKDICDRFKRSVVDANDPRMHVLLEATLLHEMVHWGDWMDGKVTAGELGKTFEKEAYGRDIRRYWGPAIP